MYAVYHTLLSNVSGRNIVVRSRCVSFLAPPWTRPGRSRKAKTLGKIEKSCTTDVVLRSVALRRTETQIALDESLTFPCDKCGQFFGIGFN